MAGAEMIVVERLRQVQEEEHTAGHDATHNDRELVRAAIAYAMLEGAEANACESATIDDASQVWPWHLKYFKPKYNSVRNLVVAGALIAAEIDRLFREEAKAIDG